MQETRRARLASVIQRELSVFLSREVKDPRVPLVTITSVQVTQDGSQATILITKLGGWESDEQTKDCIAGLTSAAGFMRKFLGGVLNTRHTPSLIFKADRGFENTLRVNELLQEIENSKKDS